MTTRIGGRSLSYGSYYADEPAPPASDDPVLCDLCYGDGVVRPVWHREPTLEEQLALLRAKRQIRRIPVEEPLETCYRCEGTGNLAKEWMKRLTMEEARSLVAKLRS